ncbi:nitronate monooxygenase family protein [Ahrensia sp. R2A130]|uniref:NAD(P)H-dependent flavin oxidoreductase n=1 Tax=Ahrensia sp. R2A130 TaxID=744979 RepID=UPI0001E0E093|nr:nitronate monooxygenase [Ahrensia sp. R2A130]EFL89841.1 2-nitropropane dioxygenase NPD [Ahrensia sp. R2A130]
MVTIPTRLTKFFDIQHPIISAPMALAAGGALAGAVSRAGGLGLLGGAYAVDDWIETQWREAGNADIGCGFITWKLKQALVEQPDLLDQVLARKPKALFLSFDDPHPLSNTIRDAGVPLVVQVQTLRDAKRAMDCGADVIVAQGAEGGGHGERRATMTIVPEVADEVARTNSNAILCAAGGIADGRGLAAALMLGAEGVVMGSRLWASEEAIVHPAMLEAAITATGDDTIRSSVMDIARTLEWPDRYTARVLKNAFTERWHDDLDGLIANAEAESTRWKQAWVDGEVTTANTFVGEATGMISGVRPAANLIEETVMQASALLKRYA